MVTRDIADHLSMASSSLFSVMMCYGSKMDDDDFETYGNEELLDVRLKDGLDLTDLQHGIGQEFEVEVADAPNGKLICFDLLSRFTCSLRIIVLTMFQAL